MYRFILKRILLLIPTLIAVSFVVYFIIDLSPADAVDVQYGNELTIEEKDEIREERGLNDPFLARYFRYMKGFVRGDMGVSYVSGESVFKLYIQKLPNTIKLTLTSIVLSLLIAIPLGVKAALNQNTWVDASSTALGLLGISLPTFATALLLILLFSLKLELLPSFGNEHWYSIILPAFTLAVHNAGLLLRTTRSSMLEVIRQDFVRTARTKGVPEKTVIRKHAFRNALIPIIAVAGTNIAINIGGAVIMETVFAWPGVGRMIITGIGTRDIDLVTGSIILTTMLSSSIILLTDIAYGFVDPRIKARYARR